MSDTQKIILKWNEHDTLCALTRDYMLEDTSLTEDEAYQRANSSELITDEFDYFLESFGELLSRISPSGYFFVKGHNLGWRKQSGSSEIFAKNALEFISRVFPRTFDWSLDGEMTQGVKLVLEIRLYHHDAPTGENYEIMAGG